MATYEINREEELKKKVIPQTKRDDFEAFWKANVEQLRQKPIEIKREVLKTPYEKTFMTYQISYNTHDDTWIDAYFSVPVGAKEKLPCVAWFHGGGGRKEIHAEILATGVCCFAMDVREQGGSSPDKAVYESAGANGGMMTRGILNKDNYYMRNIYLDAVRAMDVIAQLPEVDPERIVTCGGSQGGALSIVASALSGHSKKCYSYITSYCCLKQRTELGSGVFSATHRFLKDHPQHTDKAFETLSYFDIINMVSMLEVPVSFAMGLSDPVCLPHFVYSAYAHTPTEKTVDMYPFVEHILPVPYKYKKLEEFSKL